MSSTVDSIKISSAPTQYVKNGIDLGEWVDDFVDDEVEYYNNIHSFADGRSILLRIFNSDGERISSAVLLDSWEDDACLVHPVLEVKRRTDDDSVTIVRKEHVSILDWYHDVCGGDVPLTDVFDNILIGDAQVPLWRVLEVVSEEADSHQKAFLAYNQEVNHQKPEDLLTLSGLVAILVLLISVLGYILVSTNMNDVF